jgi:lysophospholipase L1-like esterase
MSEQSTVVGNTGIPNNTTIYGVNVPIAPNNKYVSQPTNKYTYWWLNSRNFNSYKLTGVGGGSADGGIPTGDITFFPYQPASVDYYINAMVFSGQKDRIKQTGKVRSIKYYRPDCSGYMNSYPKVAGSSRLMSIRYATPNAAVTGFMASTPILPTATGIGTRSNTIESIYYLQYPSGLSATEGDCLGAMSYLVGFHAISGDGHQVKSRYAVFTGPTASMLWQVTQVSPFAISDNNCYIYNNIYVPIQIEMEESPTFIVLGDDFGAGYPEHRTCYENENKWNQDYNVGYQLSLLNSGSYQNASIGYNTSTDIKNRLSEDCLEKLPRFAVIICGYNDIASGITLDTFSANMTYVYNTMYNSGITPIATTILAPNSAQYNDWIKNNIGTYSGLYVDISSLNNNQYKHEDGIHLNSTGISQLAYLIYNNAIIPQKQYAKINKNRTYLNPGTMNFKNQSIYDV